MIEKRARKVLLFNLMYRYKIISYFSREGSVIKLFVVSLLMYRASMLLGGDIAVVSLAIGDQFREAVALGIENKRLYCQKHDYDFICEEKSLDKSRPHAWSKILLILKVMENPQYKWIFWTDADSLIMNLALPLEDLIDENYNLIISQEKCIVNTGQFLIKNCEWSQDFLINIYSHIECINHYWWDQGALNFELLNDDNLLVTKILPQRVLNSYPVERDGDPYTNGYHKGDFIIHFAGIRQLNDLHYYMKLYSQKVVDGFEFLDLDPYPYPYPYLEDKSWVEKYINSLNNQ